MMSLGRKYKNGDGVDQSLKKAAYWYIMGLFKAIAKYISFVLIMAAVALFKPLMLLKRTSNNNNKVSAT